MEARMAHGVVIAGGGYGGLYAAKGLRGAPVEVTPVDRRNHHIFTPLLCQVATGALAPSKIAQPLRTILRGQPNARVLLGEAVDVDPRARLVSPADGDAIAYDTLIVARTVLWAAGVEVEPFGRALAAATGAPVDRSGS
jgi:NADH dehydrogenase